MATCCGQKKDVLVKVYVEKPTKRRVFLHHHHLYVHRARHNGSGGGYNRKAELLNYARNLQASARSQKALTPKPVSRVNQQPAGQSVAAQNKRKHDRRVSCFGNWNMLNPGLLRSSRKSRIKKENKKKKRKKSSDTTRMTTSIVQMFQGQKKGNCFEKLFARLKKYR